MMACVTAVMMHHVPLEMLFQGLCTVRRNVFNTKLLADISVAETSKSDPVSYEVMRVTLDVAKYLFLAVVFGHFLPSTCFYLAFWPLQTVSISCCSVSPGEFDHVYLNPFQRVQQKPLAANAIRLMFSFGISWSVFNTSHYL